MSEDIEAFEKRAFAFFSTNFPEIKIERHDMSPVNEKKLHEVITKNVVIQTMFEKASQMWLEGKSKNELKGMIEKFQTMQMNLMILVVRMVIDFLARQFMNHSSETMKKTIETDFDSTMKCIQYMCFDRGSTSFNEAMKKFLRVTEGGDPDRTILCVVITQIRNLFWYTNSATDEVIDHVLCITPKRRKLEGGSSSGEGEKESREETKRKDAEGKQPASSNGSEAASKEKHEVSDPKGKQPAKACDKDLNKTVHDKTKTFFLKVYKDPLNYHGHWEYKTVQELRDLTTGYKDEFERVTYGCDLMDAMQASPQHVQPLLNDIVTGVLPKIFDEDTNINVVKDVTKNAVALLLA